MIGINTLLENPTGENVNVGVAFAVAVNTAKRSLPQMTAGETRQPSLARVSPASTSLRRWPRTSAREWRKASTSRSSPPVVPPTGPGLQGAFQSENAAANSQTISAGGDVILSIDGEAVSTLDELAGYLDQNNEPGDSVELRVLRGGEELSVQAVLAEWPA